MEVLQPSVVLPRVKHLATNHLLTIRAIRYCVRNNLKYVLRATAAQNGTSERAADKIADICGAYQRKHASYSSDRLCEVSPPKLSRAFIYHFWHPGYTSNTTTPKFYYSNTIW